MQTAKVLIVEDNFPTAQRVKISLEKKGYKITGIATSGNEALDAMEREQADLVLMDIYLNGTIEGIITARKIKEQYPVPVIYITELKDEEIFKQAKETFPKHYITKPYTDTTLLHAVELAIQQPDSPRLNFAFDQVQSLTSEAVFVQTKEGMHKKYLLSNILYIQAHGSSSSVYFENSNNSKGSCYFISKNSTKLASYLNFQFLEKVHKSFYVNLQRVESIHNADINIRGTSTTIPIGREFKTGFYKRIKHIKHNPGQE